MKKLIFMLFCLSLITACSSSDDMPWSEESGNPIGLSETELDLDGNGGEYYVSANKTGWTPTSIEVDGVDFMIDNNNGEYSGTFGWVALKCTDNEIRFTTNANYDKERSFVLNINADGKTIKLPGNQKKIVGGVEMDGVWEDNIKASPRDVVVNAAGGNFRSNTEGYLWISKIVIDGKTYASSEKERQQCCEDLVFEKKVEWLTVKRDGNDVVFSVEPNKTGKNRTFNIVLGKGNFYCWMNGAQSALRH